MLRWIALGLLSLGCMSGQQVTPDATLNRAIELHQSGKYADAITAYQQFLKAHPEAAPVRSNLGAALVREGRFPEAIREYQLSLAAAPSNTAVRFNLALAYYKSGEASLAAKEFEAVRSALPNSDKQHHAATLLLAECYIRQGEDKKVITLLEPVAASEPGDLAAAYLLGTALIHEGDEQRGAVMIQRILERGDTAEAHMLMASTSLKANNRIRALEEVDRAISLNANLPEAYNLRGRILFMTSDLSGSEGAFRKALALDPNAFEPLLFLGALLREQGRLGEAHPLLERGLQLRPGESRIRYQFAVLLAAEGEDNRAVTMLEQLVKDAPWYTEAHRSLSTTYFRVGRAADGRREREIAERMDAEVQARHQEEGRKLK